MKEDEKLERLIDENDSLHYEMQLKNRTLEHILDQLEEAKLTNQILGEQLFKLDKEREYHAAERELFYKFIERKEFSEEDLEEFKIEMQFEQEIMKDEQKRNKENDKSKPDA